MQTFWMHAKTNCNNIHEHGEDEAVMVAGWLLKENSRIARNRQRSQLAKDE